jgi:hypothetical protein
MGPKIWKAAELERLTPKERAALAKANVVYEIDEVPEHILKSARQSVQRHFAQLENDVEGRRSWPSENVISLEPEQFTTFMGFIRNGDYDAIDRMMRT